MNEIPDALPEDFDEYEEKPADWTPDKDKVSGELEEAMLGHLKDIEKAGGVGKLFEGPNHAVNPVFLEPPPLEVTLEHMREALKHLKSIFSESELGLGLANNCFHRILGAVEDEWRASLSPPEAESE